jgi:antitoxin PrlF
VIAAITTSSSSPITASSVRAERPAVTRTVVSSISRSNAVLDDESGAKLSELGCERSRSSRRAARRRRVDKFRQLNLDQETVCSLSYPYFSKDVRRQMDVTAQLSSKGQITVPKAVRDALGLLEGDQVVFRVEGRRALLARTPKLLDLAGSVPVPAQKRGTPWPEIRRRTREARAKTRA